MARHQTCAKPLSEPVMIHYNAIYAGLRGDEFNRVIVIHACTYLTWTMQWFITQEQGLSCVEDRLFQENQVNAMAADN